MMASTWTWTKSCCSSRHCNVFRPKVAFSTLTMMTDGRLVERHARLYNKKYDVLASRFVWHSRWKRFCSSSTYWPNSSSSSSTSTSTSTTFPQTMPVIHGEVSVVYQRGLPVITIPLPSRRERCHFTLRPVSHAVQDFLRHVQNEDRGIDRIGIWTVDGVRVAASTSIESLMQDDFHLLVNDIIYHVSPPASERLTHEQLERLSDVRHLVAVLYEALGVEEHQLRKERELLQKLEEFKNELEPLEKKRQELELLSNRRTNVMSWLGLGLMATQFGILARLTWWEYSWDIMEPVTYFVTYGTTMAVYAYFVLTKQDYILPEMKDRQFLLSFYKKARKSGLDVSRYNTLKDSIADIERDLGRLRDPLYLHLPQTALQDNDLLRTGKPTNNPSLNQMAQTTTSQSSSTSSDNHDQPR